ncbi:nucleotidyltransferase domain-containing protein [Polyangium sp. 15x6]|uniref:nucleotidyltransferase domain-containing protein n=1 Tax=Polyangium sp. 15x6 TaxID=3042687 RepID=UPI00249C06E0|nr:nucleotidyltransferase domain-containing protein [Polyangium sp. 15x6]MDI3281786.1 nucleotidyltransferase domain-containing protein [Polyangium sp. 15x6]
MSGDVLDRLLAVLRVPRAEIRAAYRVGSRVYGTAGPGSDEDFLVVLGKPGQRQDLAFAPGLNIVIHGVATFEGALEDQSVFALECQFAPSAHVHVAPRPPFRYTLDRKKLASSAIGRSTADWQKAKKRFVDEPSPSRKKAFHALRVPVFALQVAKTGKITDYAAANHFLAELREGPDDDFAWYEETFGKAREALCAELTKLGGKR